jgi:hypothetical protein
MLMPSLILHIANQEPVIVDVEEVPKATDTMVIGNNPRDRKEEYVDWVEDNVVTVAIPIWRINYFEVLPESDDEDFVTFYRD